jgi:succinate dehydrogenase hydrophobic anchor subunit
MSTNKGSEFIKVFKDFIVFLQSLWGILAGISVFFPLSNVLSKVIPLGNFYDEPPGSGAFEYFSPEMVTAIATLITVFVILSTFNRRHKFEAQKVSLIKGQAWLSFVIGLLSLILYLVLNFGIYGLVYGPLDISGGDPRRLIGDIMLLLSYSAFFALMTKAFMLLGMIEFFGHKS